MPFAEVLARAGLIPGIKVDAGTKPLAGLPRRGRHGGAGRAARRLAEYAALGARFAKWRAVIRMGTGRPTHDLHRGQRPRARPLRRLAQEAGLTPDRGAGGPDGRSHTHRAVRGGDGRSAAHGLRPAGPTPRRPGRARLLKPNMVLPGTDCSRPGQTTTTHRATDDRRAARHRPSRRARHRLPVRWPAARAGHGPPRRTQPPCAAAVGAELLLRTRPAGARPGRLGRRSGPRYGGTGGARRPRLAQRCGPPRSLLGRHGAPPPPRPALGQNGVPPP